MKSGPVRIWVGTRKGAYRVDGTTARRRWTVSGPFDEGSDVFHVAPDPRHPGVVYSAVNNGWWGPTLRRSKNWGKTWKELPLPGMLPIKQRSPPVEAPSATAPIKNLWHIEPGHPSEPGTVFLGIDPGMLFRSDDGGDSWTGVEGINDHPTREQWGPGAGGLCTHTILIDPETPKRMYVGISAAGSFRSDDGGEHWKPVNRGVETPFQPVKYPELGQCVHKMAFDAEDSSKLFRQDHGGIYVTRDRGESWSRIGKPLEDDFGFVVATSPTLPGDAFFAPLRGESRTTLGKQLQLYRWQGATKTWKPLVRRGTYPGEFGTHREGLAADGLDPAGLYFGTTTGQLFVSPNAGKEWLEVPYQFPGIHSVEVSDGRPAGGS